MITAGFAGEQGRDVFAVPGRLSPLSQGCNKLIQEGAEVLTSAWIFLATAEGRPADKNRAGRSDCGQQIRAGRSVDQSNQCINRA